MRKIKKSSLNRRIVSAFIALVIVIPLILLGGIFFQVGVALVGVLALKEILDLKYSHEEIPNMMMGVSVIALVMLILANNLEASLVFGFRYRLLAAIMLAMLLPVLFYKNNKYNTKSAFYMLGVVLFLGMVFNLFIVIRIRSLGLFFFLILVPILNDIFAYFIGSKMGKRKMCPSISPNKTWEGSIGGLIAGSLISIIYYIIFVGNLSFGLILMVLVLSSVGQLGDLFMSKIKRENEIKDFSNIMPGHGGILDRLDSIIFVFLTYIFLVTIL